MLLRVLVLGLLLSLVAHAEKSWETSDKMLSLKTPDTFAQVPKVQELSTLELYDKTHDLDMVVSRKLQSHVAPKKFSQTLPEMVAAAGAKVVKQGKVKVGKDNGVFFVVEGLVPERVESLYIYVALNKGSYSIIFNYPADQRAFVKGVSDKILASVQRH